MDTLNLKDRLITFINQRYQSHAAKDLANFVLDNHLFHHAPLDAVQAEFAFDHKPEVIALLADDSQVAALVAHFVRSTKQYTYSTICVTQKVQPGLPDYSCKSWPV
jgi:hypothetical protein